MTSLDTRLQRLERAAPTSSLPRLILIVGISPPNTEPPPLNRISVLNTVLHRHADETEDAFVSRVEAFATERQPRRMMAMAFQVSDGESE